MSDSKTGLDLALAHAEALSAENSELRRLLLVARDCLGATSTSPWAAETVARINAALAYTAGQPEAVPPRPERQGLQRRGGLMRTLSQIVTAVRDGERPDYEELRYAVCALDALGAFNRGAFMRLAEAERDGKTPILTSSAQWQLEEHCRRETTAGEKSPQAWIGWNNDPDNPEFLRRRRMSKRIIAEAIAKAADQQPAPQPEVVGQDTP